ncbi:MAG TPA: alcohol dehydrogenase catalytic domain-containing protein [Acidimicrobiales bacterium]|nr:alcohol dehydrogenase catalytic domain-containing protein [Acidimicrobiales bacterium]
MKVAVVTAPGRVELREEPPFDVGPDDLLVEVGACGLCTMERRLFAGEKKIYPVAPGHEVAGTVVAAGAAVEGVPGVPVVGDRVIVDLLTRCGACRQCRRGRSALCRVPQGGALSDGTISMGAGLAEHVKVRAASAYAVGDAPLDLASMGEPLACVVHSVRLSGFGAGDRVAVVGSGFMGRLHLALARHLGAESVGVVDVSAERLAEATTAGATWTSAPDDAGERNAAADTVFVTAGVPGALELAISLCDDGGTVVLYGAFPKDHTAPVAPDAIHHHEISIVGVYSQEPEDWRAAAGLLASGALAADLGALVTARYELAEVGEALTLAATSPVYRVLVGG